MSQLQNTHATNLYIYIYNVVANKLKLCHTLKPSALVHSCQLKMFSRRFKPLLTSLPIIIISAVLLISFISSHAKRSSVDNESHEHIRIANSTCSGTQYPDLCFSTILSFPYIKSQTLSNVISSTLIQTLSEVKQARFNIRNYDTRLGQKNLKILNPRDRRALEDCVELLDQTETELETSMVYVLDKEHLVDAQAQLSAAMSYQYTCLDGFAYSQNRSIRNYFKESIYNISHHVSNSLAMVSKLIDPDDESSDYRPKFHQYMNWKDISVSTYDLIVAKDGSGNFTTIKEALAIAPNSSKTRFVIYIKEGVYYEYLRVTKRKTNIMFLGDGIGKTVIKGNRSYGGGWTTFGSATLG